MPTLREILLQKEARYESVPGEFALKADETQRAVLSELLGLLDSLEREGDKILLSEKNLAAIQQISESLLNYTFDETEYLEALTTFAKEFNIQGELSNEYMALIDEDFETKAIYKQALTTSQRQATELLDKTSIDKSFIGPIREILQISVTSGASFNETVKALTQVAIGGKNKEGVLLRYVKQVAYDAFVFADAQYMRVVTEDRGYEWHQYFGGLISDSRCFCAERANGYFHINEIKHWGVTPSLWDKKAGCTHGGGRVETTNENTIFVYRGGYNCRHQLPPALSSQIPDKWIERAKKLGYVQ